jgi:DNA-binding beta-propeller fold protein YncE
VLFDGSNVWAVEFQGPILKLDSSGVVLQTVTVGADPVEPVFDGANIWVPNSANNSVSVVKASSGAVLQTLTGNGLNVPTQAAFDGERILVTDLAGNSVSLWKAADLSPLGSFLTGLNTNPIAACSDGINFWVALNNTGQLARF